MMRNLIKNTSAALVLTTVFAGSAFAIVSSNSLDRDVNLVLGGDSEITVFENNGVVTITGYYADAADQETALALLYNAKGVTKVINLAFPQS